MKVIFWGIALLLLALNAHAGPMDATVEEAQQLFDEGIEAFEEKDFSVATRAFRKAYLLNPHWKLLYNIAQSEAAQKHYDLALETFEAYLAQAGDDIAQERLDEVIKEIDRLGHLVGNVKFSGGDGYRIEIDGAIRGEAPSPVGIRIVAGMPHHLRILNDANETVMEEKLRVGSGQEVTIEIESPVVAPGDASNDDDNAALKAIANEPAAPTEPALSRPAMEPSSTAAFESPRPAEKDEQKATSPLRIAGGITMGTGGLFLVGGTVAFLVGKSHMADYREAAGVGDETRYNHLKDKLQVDQALATTGFIAGGVLVTTGITLLLWRRFKDKERIAQERFSVEVTDINCNPVNCSLAFSF